jgi:putative ABC transport system ATP-binding protein
LLTSLRVENVHKTYIGGESPVEAVRGVSFNLDQGDFVVLMGPSGCGKSTLLHLSGAMDRPTSGSIKVENTDLASLNDDRLTLLRRQRIGFVFQFFNLLPTLTVTENVELPLLLEGLNNANTHDRSRKLIDRVGLSSRANHFPQQLSGGEMQRAAIARAIIHEPALLIADEPTGNLDSENGSRILDLLAEVNRELHITILLATHSREVASIANRVFFMRDGIIERIEIPAMKESDPIAAV